MLSQKTIPPHERLIFALDVSSADEAKRLVGLLGDAVRFYKLGLELFMAGGYFELLALLHDRGCKTFVDLKLFDVPETVQRAVAALAPHHPTFVSVHGNDRILEAACKEKDTLKILAVTVLTSLDRNNLRELGFECEPQGSGAVQGQAGARPRLRRRDLQRARGLRPAREPGRQVPRRDARDPAGRQAAPRTIRSG